MGMIRSVLGFSITFKGHIGTPSYQNFMAITMIGIMVEHNVCGIICMEQIGTMKCIMVCALQIFHSINSQVSIVINKAINREEPLDKKGHSPPANHHAIHL